MGMTWLVSTDIHAQNNSHSFKQEISTNITEETFHVCFILFVCVAFIKTSGEI